MCRRLQNRNLGSSRIQIVSPNLLQVAGTSACARSPGSVTKSRRKSISGASERHRDGASFVLIGDVDENLGVSSTFSASCDRFANFCTGFRPGSLFFLSTSVRHDCINLNVWAAFIFIFHPTAMEKATSHLGTLPTSLFAPRTFCNFRFISNLVVQKRQQIPSASISVVRIPRKPNATCVDALQQARFEPAASRCISEFKLRHLLVFGVRVR